MATTRRRRRRRRKTARMARARVRARVRNVDERGLERRGSRGCREPFNDAFSVFSRVVPRQQIRNDDLPPPTLGWKKFL